MPNDNNAKQLFAEFRIYLNVCSPLLKTYCIDLRQTFYQGIIQKKSASGNRMLPLVIFDKKVPFFPKVMLF